MKRGKFVVFEGVGGSCKTTQVKLAEKFLKSKDVEFIATREPGGVEVSEKLRELIFDLRKKNLISSEGQMVLFSAAGYLWINALVKPALKKGINILTDRAHTSTTAYQGYAEGGNLDQILGISEIIMQSVLPDAVILLDISPETSIKRRIGKRNEDLFDDQDKDYLERLVLGYRKMAKENWGGLRWYLVNGEDKIAGVQESIKILLKEIFNLD